MSKQILLLFLMVLFIGCDGEYKTISTCEGKVVSVDYLNAGFRTSAKTIIKFADGGSCIFGGHHNIDSKYRYFEFKRESVNGRSVLEVSE